MQIDFHHATTYVVARDAGFCHTDADINDYLPRGEDSWKAAAPGTSDELPVYAYRGNFLGSHWKDFHDAVQAYRFNVVYNILPKYGICAA